MVMYRLVPSVLKVNPVGTTSPTRDLEQPSFSSLAIKVGIAISDELTANTSRISSLMYARKRKMLKLAAQAMAPSTITTKSTEVSQKVPISLASGPREARPNLPTVYAIAPVSYTHLRAHETRHDLV